MQHIFFWTYSHVAREFNFFHFFFSHSRHLRLFFGSPYMPILFSYPHENPNPIERRGDDQHAPDDPLLITPICSRAQPSSVTIYFIHGNVRHLDEHLKHRRTRDPLQLFVSFASVTTIWDTRESCSHHHVVVCTIFLYSSLCYGREGTVLQLAYYTMLCGSAISHCEFFWRVLQCLRQKMLINVSAPHNLTKPVSSRTHLDQKSTHYLFANFE